MKKITYLSMTLLVVYVWKEMCHMCCCWKTFRKYIKTMYWGIRLLTLLHWRNYPLLVIIVSAEYVFMVWYQFWGFVVQVVNLLFRKYHAHFASVALKPMWLIVLSLLSPLSVVLKICSFFVADIATCSSATSLSLVRERWAHVCIILNIQQFLCRDGILSWCNHIFIIFIF